MKRDKGSKRLRKAGSSIRILGPDGIGGRIRATRRSRGRNSGPAARSGARRITIPRHTNRVGIAATVQQEVFILHVREPFRVERHAHEMKVGIEAVDLHRNVDVVPSRAVAIVVGVLEATPQRYAGIDAGERIKDLRKTTVRRWHGNRTENVLVQNATRIASCPQVALLAGIRGARSTATGYPYTSDERFVKIHPHGHAVLAWADVELSNHAHLQVFGRGDVAVIEVSARVGCEIIVGGAATDVDSPSCIRHAVIIGRSIGIPVEVYGM